MIGYLSDTPPLYDEMKVGRYLEFAASLRKVPKGNVARHVQDAAQATGLTHVLTDPISSLSHGYRQRVGIAQAIVHKPKLVVLDEPSSGLDPLQIKEMRGLVRNLGGDHTVLVSSHNLPEITQMCDRLMVIGEGQIVASGTETELVKTLLSGDSLELTFRLASEWDEARAASWLSQVNGVEHVERIKTRDTGERTVSFALHTHGDCRADLAAAVVHAGHALLSLARSEKELETVFSQLARSSESEAA
jgi:ABC-2 type transport system ATP-binding protein